MPPLYVVLFRLKHKNESRHKPDALTIFANMPPSLIAQRRTHNLLLFQKLLNLRDGASPFSLLLDTLEQSSAPVVREFMVRAKVCNGRFL